LFEPLAFAYIHMKVVRRHLIGYRLSLANLSTLRSRRAQDSQGWQQLGTSLEFPLFTG
jgi:hypothetical protein